MNAHFIETALLVASAGFFGWQGAMLVGHAAALLWLVYRPWTAREDAEFEAWVDECPDGLDVDVYAFDWTNRCRKGARMWA